MDHLIAHLDRQAAERPDAPAYFVRRDGGWRPTAWAAYRGEVRAAARGLMALGLLPGDRAAVIGWNRPEWSIWALGAMAAGGAPVGIYTTSSPSEVRYVVEHSGARALLVEGPELAARLRQAVAGAPALAAVVMMDGGEPPPGVLSWPAFLARGGEVAEADLEVRVAGLRGDDLATLIYTSGTTGAPKGVMLSHANLVETGRLALEFLPVTASDTSLSYLPLSHIAEQSFTISLPALTGASVHYAESVEKVPDNLREVQPTIVFGVPRVWEKLQAAVAARLAAAGGTRRALVGWAMRVGREMAGARNAGREPGAWLALRHRVAGRLVYSRVKPLMGLGRARICVSGAAPIARQVLEFLAGLDVVVLEVYGQSEGSGPTTWNRPGRTRFGTVGPPLPGVEVRLAGDGEILLRGPNVFQGYFRDPAATAEALVDGWLHSGDLGEFDADGFLLITGRKKEILITSGGKNVAPRPIEEALARIDLVGEAMVVGDRRRYLTALLTLDPAAAARFAAERGLSPEALPGSPALRADLAAGIERVNADLARVEQVRDFRVLPRPFTVETGELTPTLKLKRRVVEQRQAALIAEMYPDDPLPCEPPA